VTANVITSKGGETRPAIARTLAPIATAVEMSGVMKPAKRHAALATLSPMTTQPSGVTFACAT
jgi:hypothetical protein